MEWHQGIQEVSRWWNSGIILCMPPANGRWCYNVTSSLIGRAMHKMETVQFAKNRHPKEYEYQSVWHTSILQFSPTQDTVECHYSAVQYNMILIWYYNDWGKICLWGYIHKRHPILCPNRGELWVVFGRIWVKIDIRMMSNIKHQSSASLAFVRGIHPGPLNSLHKWPVMRKMFPFDDVVML